MHDIAVGEIVLFKSPVYRKGLLCLIISIDKIYNIPTKDYFLQYSLFCPESIHKFRFWNSSCKNSSKIEKVN